MDLSKLSSKELKILLDCIPVEIERRRREEKTRLVEAIETLIRQHGFTSIEILRELRYYSRNPLHHKHTKYRHPEIPEFSWSGRGRQPRWVSAFLDNGGTMDQLQNEVY